MTTTVEPVPQSFLAKVLGEFGLQWAHLAVFSGVVFSSFGLEKYFNTGAWMVTAIAAFAIVFLFRREVSGRFPVVAIACVVLSAVAVAAGYFYARRSAPTVAAFLEGHRSISTVFLGASTIIPLAVLILSYRRREDLYGGNFPKEIRKAIQENLVELAFYKRGQRYEFSVLEVTEAHVKVNSVLTYTLFNRTGSVRPFDLTLTPMRQRTEFVSVEIDGQDLDVDDPRIRTERGLEIPWEFPPGRGVPVRLEANVWYRPADSDLLASYFPATDFELVVRNPFPSLRIVVECLFKSAMQPLVDGDVRRYVAVGGSVPYQGFKLDWMPR